MEPTDITIAILREIRDEIRANKEEVRRTNERLDRLEQRQMEAEVRIASELIAVAKAVDKVHSLLEENLAVRKTVEDHEQRIRLLETRADL